MYWISLFPDFLLSDKEEGREKVKGSRN